MSTPYQSGRNARKAGASVDSNPFNEVLRVTKAGTAIYADDESRSQWACGWRDENDDIHKAKFGALNLSDFVQRKSRKPWRR